MATARNTKYAPVTDARVRVAAYCRISMDSEGQATSIDLQRAVYENMIASNPNWELAEVYADRGITRTVAGKRPEFQRMIADCKAGKIDRIITKSLSRFARNTMDCMTPMERKRNDDRTLTIHWRCGIKTKVSSGVTRDSAHPKHIAQLWDAFVLRYPDRYPEITQQVLELDARERGEVG